MCLNIKNSRKTDVFVCTSNSEGGPIAHGSNEHEYSCRFTKVGGAPQYIKNGFSGFHVIFLIQKI